MASPRIVMFAIFDSATKAPATGLMPTFAWYSDETGTPLTQPAITEIGGGLYKFTPALVANHSVEYMLDCGATADDRYPYEEIRAEDFDLDKVSGIATSLTTLPGLIWDEMLSAHRALGTFGDLMRLLFLVFAGHVKLDTVAGKFYVYAEDGSTTFQVQTTKNSIGAAGGLDATERLTATRP